MITRPESAALRGTLLATLLTLTLPTGALAAGGHGMSMPGHGPAGTTGMPGKASEATRTVEIVLTENLYDPESVTVAKGETVRFVLRNKGQLVHEFNIGTAAMHAAHQKEMAVMVEHGVLEPDRINRERMKMDMGGGRTMEHNDPNSVLLEPGKTGEMVWKFTEAADIEFACNVPGHYEAGMVGKFHVK